jgi:hypothetical protein
METQKLMPEELLLNWIMIQCTISMLDTVIHLYHFNDGLIKSNYREGPDG